MKSKWPCPFCKIAKLAIVGAQGPEPETVLRCGACGYVEILQEPVEDVEDVEDVDE